MNTRRLVIIASLIGWTIIFLLAIKLPETLLMFILFGMVPGTSAVLRADDMIALWTFLASGIIAFILGPSLYRYLLDKKIFTPTHRRAAR